MNGVLALIGTIILVSSVFYLWGALGFATILNWCDEDPRLLKRIDENAVKSKAYRRFFLLICLPLAVILVSTLWR